MEVIVKLKQPGPLYIVNYAINYSNAYTLFFVLSFAKTCKHMNMIKVSSNKASILNVALELVIPRYFEIGM